MKRYFTTGETAEFCGVTLRTVINWIKRGRLQAHQLPGSRGDNRISPRDLLEFMQNTGIPAPPELLALTDLKTTVLVVDDDPLMAKAIKRVFVMEGYKVYLAHNGFEAGMLYQQHKPKLITLDLQMPKLDGFELLKRLQSRGGTKILVISAMEVCQLERACELGADGYLSKPFDNEALINKASHIIKA